VVYFPGCTANYNDPGGERRATIEILEHNGFEVIVPEGLCCGLPAQSLGARMLARDDALRTVNVLSRYADEGIPILATASSCGYTIRREYPVLLGTVRARQVADATVDVHEFLLDLHREGKLKTDFKRIATTCILHASCHMQAARGDAAARGLLQLIPDLELLPSPKGCCGMGGSFGFKAESFATSVAIGRLMTDELRRLNPTFLVTTNGNCRPQLEQGTNRKVLHTMTLLHKAYGLSPMKGVHRQHEGLAYQTMAGYMEKSRGGS
jgi:glycerol-3-phosphate dehydrogenase subunit C